MKYLILDQIFQAWIKFGSSPIKSKNTHSRYMYMYTWMYACFPFSWLGQWSGKTLLTALHKYLYQNGKAFPSHPEHAQIPFVFLSLCGSPNLRYSPVLLLALHEELNRSDGCAASLEAPGQVLKHTCLQAWVALQISWCLGLHQLGRLDPLW